MTTMQLIANFIWLVLQLIANSIWDFMQLIAYFIKQRVPLKESLDFALKRKGKGCRSSLLLGFCKCDSCYSPSGFLSSVRTVENLFTTKIIWWRRGHCRRCVWCCHWRNGSWWRDRVAWQPSPLHWDRGPNRRRSDRSAQWSSWKSRPSRYRREGE